MKGGYLLQGPRGGSVVEVGSTRADGGDLGLANTVTGEYYDYPLAEVRIHGIPTPDFFTIGNGA
jgi:hypothetical protein